MALTVVLLKGSAKLGVLPSNILLVLKKIENKSIAYSLAKFGRVDQGSYRQDCVKFKDFSRTSQKLFHYFQGLKT